MDRIPALHVSLHLALINSYRLLATTQILRAVELAPGQRTKIYLFIRCSSPAACSPVLRAGQALVTHTHSQPAHTTQAQLAIHTRHSRSAKFGGCRLNAPMRLVCARTSVGGGRPALTAARARRTACEQLFALKSSTDKSKMIALPRGARCWRTAAGAGRCGSVRRRTTHNTSFDYC